MRGSLLWLALAIKAVRLSTSKNGIFGLQAGPASDFSPLGNSALRRERTLVEASMMGPTVHGLYFKTSILVGSWGICDGCISRPEAQDQKVREL